MLHDSFAIYLMIVVQYTSW